MAVYVKSKPGVKNQGAPWTDLEIQIGSNATIFNDERMVYFYVGTANRLAMVDVKDLEVKYVNTNTNYQLSKNPVWLDGKGHWITTDRLFFVTDFAAGTGLRLTSAPTFRGTVQLYPVDRTTLLVSDYYLDGSNNVCSFWFYDTRAKTFSSAYTTSSGTASLTPEGKITHGMVPIADRTQIRYFNIWLREFRTQTPLELFRWGNVFGRSDTAIFSSNDQNFVTMYDLRKNDIFVGSTTIKSDIPSGTPQGLPTGKGLLWVAWNAANSCYMPTTLGSDLNLRTQTDLSEKIPWSNNQLTQLNITNHGWCAWNQASKQLAIGPWNFTANNTKAKIINMPNAMNSMYTGRYDHVFMPTTLSFGQSGYIYDNSLLSVFKTEPFPLEMPVTNARRVGDEIVMFNNTFKNGRWFLGIYNSRINGNRQPA